ncbi:2OG-Fe(II) oxygenase [Sinorhizobium fredii]|uniref:2OG-Fe(II) oxygenase n=1 Tax=Rhizobium fredii TaxID=380 RepID=UPI003513FFF1
MFKRLAPYVFYAPSFIQASAADSIRSEADAWDDWSPAVAARYKDDQIVASAQIKELRDVLVNRRRLSKESEALLRIDEAVEQANRLFGINGVKASRYVVSKYIKDCHIKPHTDTDFFNTSRVYTGVYYLNSGYDGGEIYFPTFGVSMKPDAGSLLLFLAEYLHGVNAIASGTRFSVVWFGLVNRG